MALSYHGLDHGWEHVSEGAGRPHGARVWFGRPGLGVSAQEGRAGFWCSTMAILDVSQLSFSFF